jgi:hypothetical protein
MLTTDDIHQQLDALYGKLALPLPAVMIQSRRQWERGWNVAFPHMAFTNQELDDADQDGYIGDRAGAKCYLDKPVEL